MKRACKAITLEGIGSRRENVPLSETANRLARLIGGGSGKEAKANEIIMQGEEKRAVAKLICRSRVAPEEGCGGLG